MSDLVVKTNRLNMAIQNLSIVEIRLIQIAIVDSRETQTGLTADTPLRVDALRYAKVFDVDRTTAYEMLIAAEKTLFERQFSFIDDDEDTVKSRWISQAKYKKGEGVLEIILTPAVVREITRIDGNEDIFTKYVLGQTANLNSVYSVRLYELLAQWRKGKKTPVFDIETFRGQLGLGVSDYTRMSDFKRRVLDSSVKEINEKTDLKVSYKQEKNKSTITGFKFVVLENTKTQKPTKQGDRDEDTPDLFHSLTEKQVQLFGSKLANDNAFGGKYGKVGEDTKAFENRIKQELMSIENQQKWLTDLMRVGYSIKS